MKSKQTVFMVVAVIGIIVLMCFGYFKLIAEHNGDMGEMMEEQYFYLRPDDTDPQLLRSYHTPQRGEEIFKDNKYYIIDRIVYDLDSHNLNVYCRLKE